MIAVYKCEWGYIRIQYEHDVLLSLTYTEQEVVPAEGESSSFAEQVFAELVEYLGGKRKTFDIKYKLIGTKFQLAVWRELLKIPYGETRSYKEIAQALGNAQAARAVGNANNKNPLQIIVPCHRVIGADGDLKGYAAGVGIKAKLLKLERQGQD